MLASSQASGGSCQIPCKDRLTVADIIFPVLGVVGGLVLLIAGYALWRGPYRRFMPTCGTRRRGTELDAEQSRKRNDLSYLYRADAPMSRAAEARQTSGGAQSSEPRPHAGWAQRSQSAASPHAGANPYRSRHVQDGASPDESIGLAMLASPMEADGQVDADSQRTGYFVVPASSYPGARQLSPLSSAMPVSSMVSMPDVPRSTMFAQAASQTRVPPYRGGPRPAQLHPSQTTPSPSSPGQISSYIDPDKRPASHAPRTEHDAHSGRRPPFPTKIDAEDVDDKDVQLM